MNDVFNFTDYTVTLEETSIEPTVTKKSTSTIGASIPSSDKAYIEEEEITLQGQAPFTVQFNIPSKPTLEHEIEMWDTLNEFETSAWSSDNTGLKSGFASIDKAFDGGIYPGLIVLAGDSNLGKSGLLSQLAWQISDLNPDAYVMDFSLDDPMPDKLARIIGCNNKVLLNAVKNPNKFAHYPTMLLRRKQGLNKLRTRIDRYKAYDSNFSSYCEDIEEEVKRVIINIEATGIKKKVVVVIDGLHDLNLKDKSTLMDKQKYDVIASWGADLSKRYNISVIASAELKKINGTKRPMLDDIKETGKIKYEAKAVLLIYNEVHYKAEAAEVHFLRSDSPLKQPVLEVHVAKNKFHSYKGRLFFEFYPEMARFEEPDAQSVKHYASVIFSS